MEAHGLGEEAERVSRWEGMEMGKARRMCFAMREAEKTASAERYRHSLRCRNWVETDFGPDLGDRKASASTGIADSIFHELSHRAVAAPAERTAIRRI